MRLIKSILVIITAAAAFFGCKKESYVAAFDEKPHERVQKQMDTLSTRLKSSTGWVGTLSTGLGGGYGFYMTFDNQEVVKMYADLTNPTASTVKESRYSVKQDAGAMLSFDTYTYISILNNPETSAFGGTLREGFRSDIDFIYDRSTEDTIVLIGKRYRQTFTLVKATAAQKTKYEAGEYLTAITGFKQFFTSNPNSYFELNGTKVAVEVNSSNTMASGKRLTLTGLFDNAITSATQQYAYTIDKMDIVAGGLKFRGIIFKRLAWKNSTTLAIYDSNGNEYILNNSPTPLLPLHLLWGAKYSGMRSDFKVINPGTSTAGATILNYYHNNLNNTTVSGGFSFNCGNITMTWDITNKRLNLNGFCSQNNCGSGWTTTGVYNYTKDDNGVYTFTLRTALSGGYVTNHLAPMHNFLISNTVKFDYYVDGGTVYGNMISVNNPGTNMTFVLY